MAEPVEGKDEDAEDIETAPEADVDAQTTLRNDEPGAYILTAAENGYGKRTPAGRVSARAAARRA